MNLLLIICCALCGLILLLQLVLLLRKSGDKTQDFQALTQKLHEAGISVGETRDAQRQLAAEVSQMRGRLDGFEVGQQNAAHTIRDLRANLPLELQQGIVAVGASLKLALTEQVVPELAAGKAALAEGLIALRTDATQQRDAATQHRNELALATTAMRTEITTALRSTAESVDRKVVELRESVEKKLSELKSTIDSSLKTELGAIRTENAAKLEEMRRTVDEKLHETLEQRLGESFKIVSDRLELVHRGLGEMQTLAAGVGDLKKVLTNVKTRGTWGEVQLDALLEQILTAEQYGKNVATKPGSSARVEFAIRLPGRSDDGTPVWLPIDAKFPMEDYQRLVEAQERADLPAIEDAGKALENRIKAEARNIRDKYVDPPHTTDFAILYLPTEGLYAEVLRRPGLADNLQRDSKISIAGPTTLAAMLNSLQMGFRTLAIEKRSSEVWTVLGVVKTEFGKFGEALAHAKKKIEEAGNSIDRTEQRNRVLTRKLANVEAIAAPDPAAPLDGAAIAELVVNPPEDL